MNVSIQSNETNRRLLFKQNQSRNRYKTAGRFLCLMAVAMLILTSCKTREKVLYFQDISGNTVMPTQAISPLTYVPGDKLTVVVTSSATPQLAMKFNLPVVTIQAGAVEGRSSTSNQISVYTIDENGCIDIPSLGRVKVAGLTRAEVSAKVQSLLRDGKLNDAVVTVSSYDQYITVMGEVARPGRVSIAKDNITLLEALGAAGDLTIQARRDNILVLRQEGNETKSYYVDIRSKDLLNSPVYNLRQNDVIYVQPNTVRIGQSTNNDNSVRSISTWLSISSFLLSLSILIFK